MDIKQTIAKLCNTDGISGFEQNICATVQEMLLPYCDRVEIDKLNNVVGYISCGDENAPTLMLDAHIDQIGFIVADVLDGGFLRFAPIGGVDPRMLLGCELKILADQHYFGVVSCMPPHLIKPHEASKSQQITEMVIDTGFLDAKDKIKIGTPIVFGEDVTFLSDNTVTGKCLDDRACLASIIYALDMLKGKKLSVNLVILASSCEETGLVGATVASFRLRPDFAIAVDVSHAKTPDAPSSKTFDFGGGVMIGMGPNLDRKMSKSMKSICSEEDIPFQLEIMEGNTGTNAWAIQVSRTGIATALLSVPLKYMHTPIETISLKDFKSTSKLLYHFILGFDFGTKTEGA